MRDRVILSIALALLVAPLAFAGQDAKATNAADNCFQVTELALAQGQPQLVMVGGLGSRGECVRGCEKQRQAGFQRCLDSGEPPNRCARAWNSFARRCKDNCPPEADP